MTVLPATLISVCVPTWNRVEFLRICLNSIIKQDYENIEIVVSDNASTDSTEDMIRALILINKKFKIKYLRAQQNCGMVPNWNKALMAAEGIFAIVLSDDDILKPDAISHLYKKLIDTQCAFVYSTVILIDENGHEIGRSKQGPPIETAADFIKHTIKGYREPFPSALLFKTADAINIGGFPDIKSGTDVAFRLLLAKYNEEKVITCAAADLIYYRMHRGSLTSNKKLVYASTIELNKWLLFRYDINTRLKIHVLYETLHLKCSIGDIQDVKMVEQCDLLVKAIDIDTMSPWNRYRFNFAIYEKCSRLCLVMLFPLLALNKLSKKIIFPGYTRRIKFT